MSRKFGLLNKLGGRRIGVGQFFSSVEACLVLLASFLIGLLPV